MTAHRSFWRLDRHDEGRGPGAAPAGRYDVVVAGAGVAGLTAAHLLARRGARVAVLERSTIGSGTSGGTTAKVSALQGAIYSTLAAKHPPHVGQAYAAANLAGLDELAGIVE